MRIAINEATASKRRFGFQALQLDGISPALGITFGAAEVKINKAYGGEANFAGTITELGGGVYFYEPTVTEVNTLGALTLRTARAGVLTDFREHQVV